jgi:bifunctional enzyme CysN/CysC
MTGHLDLLGDLGEPAVIELVSAHPQLRRYLAQREASARATARPFRITIDAAAPDRADPRRVTGTVVSGTARPGDEVEIAPSRQQARIERIVAAGAELEVATAGQAVELQLDEQRSLGPGDLIGPLNAAPRAGRQLQATVIWLADEPLLRGRSYGLRLGVRTVTATVAPVRYRLDLDSMAHVAATKLERLEIGVCDLELSAPIAFDPFDENPSTGAFALVDRISSRTVGAGLIEFALHRSANLRWQDLSVDREARARAMGQTPCVLWFTGLSGSGKSTIANRVEAELHGHGRHTYLLDGDNVRHGLNRDLGFTDADRVENIRRVAEVSRLMVDAGLIVIVSFISPFASERRMARALFEPGRFLEVFVDTPLAVAEQRDPKGLYAKARRGELVHFTGIDSPYEAPEHPELRLDTTRLSAVQSVVQVLALLDLHAASPPLQCCR